MLEKSVWSQGRTIEVLGKCVTASLLGTRQLICPHISSTSLAHWLSKLFLLQLQIQPGSTVITTVISVQHRHRHHAPGWQLETWREHSYLDMRNDAAIFSVTQDTASGYQSRYCRYIYIDIWMLWCYHLQWHPRHRKQLAVGIVDIINISRYYDAVILSITQDTANS